MKLKGIAKYGGPAIGLAVIVWLVVWQVGGCHIYLLR